MEEVASKLKGLVETETNADNRKTLQNRLDAANKALALLKDKSQKMFERGITKMQGYLDDTNLPLTNCGTRSSKLALIESRLQTQKTNFETLKSENEDVDITEVAIQLTSAELTYEAALMATGKVMQNTLMNFI
jgi:flagellar hook-associated protein 3 FlgL